MADKPLKIPFMIMDKVTTPPVKQSGYRTMADLDQLASIPDDAEILVQYNQKTYRTTKAQLISPLTSEGLWDDYVGSLAGGDAKALFGLQLDLHYQKDRIGTALKEPPFRT